jgi:hypothetical protein
MATEVSNYTARHLTNRRAHQEGIYRQNNGVHGLGAPTNKPDKSISEKAESSNKRTRAWRNSTRGQAYAKEYTGTIHLVTMKNSIQLPTTITSTEDSPSKFLTTEKNSDVCSGAAGYISWEETFSFFNQSSRSSNFLSQISKRLGGYTQWVQFFFKKLHVTWKTTSKQDHFKASRRKNLEWRKFSSSTMKYSGACRYRTHRVP